MNIKFLHRYVEINIDKLVEAWARQYDMILLKDLTVNGLSLDEKIWKNSSSFRPQWYSETEIKEYIADMDMVELQNLIEYQKGL